MDTSTVQGNWTQDQQTKATDHQRHRNGGDYLLVRYCRFLMHVRISWTFCATNRRLLATYEYRSPRVGSGESRPRLSRDASTTTTLATYETAAAKPNTYKRNHKDLTHHRPLHSEEGHLDRQ